MGECGISFVSELDQCKVNKMISSVRELLQHVQKLVTDKNVMF